MIKFKRIAIFFAIIVLFASCPKVEIGPAAFTVKGIPPLTPLSKAAATGIAALSGPINYEYTFETAMLPPENSSLEITYNLRGRNLSTVSEDKIPLIIHLGENSWELPVDFSFLGGLVTSLKNESAEEEIAVKYIIPLPSAPVENIILTYDGQKNENDFSIQINSLSLADRWFGFAGGRGQTGTAYSLSPFVFTDDSNLTLDPPVHFLPSSGNEFYSESTGQAVSLTAGKLRFDSLTDSLRVPSIYLKNENFPLIISNSKTIKEASLVPAQNPVFPLPVPADPGLILDWPREAWRDKRLEIFSMEGFPSILIFDMGDYNVQDKFLKRIAFFVEKAGYRGTLVTHREIAHLHGWNAHNYRAESLAEFYDLMKKANMTLIEEEKELETILFRNGIIRRDADGGIVPGEGAILSISRETPGYLRDTFMIHEVFHGLFFIDESFRDFCYRRWDSFENPGKHFFVAFLRNRLYDTTDTYMVINEFMGYMLQQRLTQTESYYRRIFANPRINVSPWDGSSLTKVIEIFNKEAAILSDYVSRRWGYEAGRVRSITMKGQ